MFYLLLAIAICLLVPWLPILVYRRLPRRPPPPLSEGALHRLAGQLHGTQLAEAVEVGSVEADPTITAITRPVEFVSDTPGRGASASEDREEQRPESDRGPTREMKRTGAFSLSLPSDRWLNAVAVPIAILTSLALGFGWAVLFDYLGEARSLSFQPVVFLFKPSYGLVCAVPALLLGILCSLPLMTVLARLLMGHRRFLEYLFWDEGRLGSRQVEGMIRLLSGLCIFLSIVSALFVYAIMNWYARFAEDEIAIKRFIGFGEEVRSYSDVEQIVVTAYRRQDKQTLVPGQVLGVRFSDGRTWSTDQPFALPSDASELERLLDFLCRKSGKPITRARLLRDVPGW
jgi:hypothetical protein